MNKWFASTVIVTILLGATILLSFRSSDQLVYVDVNQLMEGYERTKVEREAFEETAATLRSNVDSLMNDWQVELKQYEKERSAMSKKELVLKQELLGNKQQQINNYQQAIQQQITEEDQKVTQTVINDINDYVKEYGEKHHHKIIFGASGSGNIMYANESTDLTDEILEGLNAAYQVPE